MNYVGNDLKYVFSASGDFSFDEMEWDMVFSVGSKSARMSKRNVPSGGWELSCTAPNMGCKPLSDGSWVFLLDTAFFGPGRLVAVLNAHIPDADFDPTEEFPELDSIRNEVRRFALDSIDELEIQWDL